MWATWSSFWEGAGALAWCSIPCRLALVQWEDLIRPGVVIVSGKGGTGKSTVAAALATAAAACGRRALLAEVEGRGEIARTLGIGDPGFAEQPTPFGFNVVSVTPHETVREYLRRYAGMRRIPRPLLRTGAVDQIITATPGLRDLLALGMIYETYQVRPKDHRGGAANLYDLVVIDAPPTGQIAAFLSAPEAFSGLVRVGRIRRQAASVARMLRRSSRVVLVSLPEEMAVAETLEAIQGIRSTGVTVAAIVANRVHPHLGTRSRRSRAGRLDADEVVRVAKEAGLDLDASSAQEVLESQAVAERKAKLQRGFVSRLAEGAPLLLLPDLAGVASGDLVPRLAGLLSGEEATRSAAPEEPAARRIGLPQTTSLEEPLGSARVVVVCGSGGTGKTTVSAAIAVRMAQNGLRTVLLTVDPARRLATALGLPMVPADRIRVPLGSGRSMDAVQLDTKRTFDEIVERFATGPEQVDRILSNPVYRRMTDTLGGTHEYMAMEKLHQLAEGTDYQAIVIDTPPTRSALAFLDAPKRLTDFLGGRFLRWVLWPSTQAGKLTVGAARVGASAFLRTVGRLVGAEALADMAEFLGAFQGMHAGFKQRAAKVLALMQSEDCEFVVVAAPTEASLDEAGYFVTRLSDGGMRAAAVVVNRWHPVKTRLPEGSADAARRLLDGSSDEQTLGVALGECLLDERRAAAEAESVTRFASVHPVTPLVAVPELDGDVHDVPGLRAIASHLFS
jgi:anion-transporting  ArsA/GET3 family ATPase